MNSSFLAPSVKKLKTQKKNLNEEKVDNPSIKKLAKTQILNSEYKAFRNIEHKMHTLEQKFHEIEREKHKIIGKVHKLCKNSQKQNNIKSCPLLNKFTISINKKLDNLIEKQQNIENILSQLDEIFKYFKNQFAKLDTFISKTKNSHVETTQQFEPEFMKASDLLQPKINENQPRSDIKSKIDICNQLLNYLDLQFESKSITREEYEENKKKVKLKIKKLEKMMIDS